MNVGTKILIKKTCRGCWGAERKVGIVTNKPHYSGLHESKPGYNVELENGVVWRINPDAEVEILEIEFDKHLLRDGVIVKRKGGSYAIVSGDHTYSKTEFYCLNNYFENLKSKHVSELDIVAIYEPTGTGTINNILDGQYLRLIAERPEEVREMTLDEICKELGYNVKIVKEDK